MIYQIVDKKAALRSHSVFMRISTKYIREGFLILWVSMTSVIGIADGLESLELKFDYVAHNAIGL